jgi:hypothetical protein
MIYLLAIFLPPVYFLIKRRWMAFALTFAMLLVSIFFLFAVYLAPAILILWFLSAAIAVWDVRRKVVKQ